MSTLRVQQACSRNYRPDFDEPDSIFCKHLEPFRMYGSASSTFHTMSFCSHFRVDQLFESFRPWYRLCTLVNEIEPRIAMLPLRHSLLDRFLRVANFDVASFQWPREGVDEPR